MPRHSVSVVGIVIDVHDRILVIKRRDNGHWQPPGGVLELHETLEQGVCREVAEETGVQVEVGRLSGVYKNVKDGIIAVTFRCRPLTEAVSQTSEAAQITWIDTADVSRLMTPTFAARVLDAFEPMPQVRAHDGTNLRR
ncbi:MAG: NUDIX hydrolase [Pseudonocardiaceae bacterium]